MHWARIRLLQDHKKQAPNRTQALNLANKKPKCAAESRVGLERGWACIGLELHYSNTTKNKPQTAPKRSQSVPRSPGWGWRRVGHA